MIKKGDKKIIRAWTFYDLANSVYPLVITTAIFPMFYEYQTSHDAYGNLTNDLVEFLGGSFRNTQLYSYVISVSFIIVSIISPLLSGLADYSDSKKSFLKFFCYLGSLACASLFFFDVNHLELSMIPVLLASVGFWGSLVFYNAYLPEIAHAEDHDKISARGYSLGYVGSSVLLILNLVAIMGFDMPVKYAFLSVAVWWIGFSQYTYAYLPNASYSDKPKENKFTKGFKELKKVWGELKELTTLKRYLGSFFVYSMGVQTVMIMATLFAAKEINWEGDGAKTGLIVSVLIIQFIAIGGAYLFSWFSSKIGNIASLSITLFIWVFICLGAYFIHEPIEFYVIAASVGLVMGGIQSLSRSTYSKLLPQTKDHASFFSFYDVIEKLGIVIGTFAYGFIEGWTGSMRNSIYALGAFFIVGFVLLLRVPKNEQIAANKS
ncbi:MFS transporter [Vicingaceae bacterium]|nr:MFS transporter [Vicingaceae bacterium]MDB4060658.1 MFS transporter [Vicingaceae bacterium]